MLLTLGVTVPAKAAPCSDVVFKGCLLDSLAAIDATSDDYIVRINSKLLLRLLDGDPDDGIAMLNKIDDAPLREFLSGAVVRALEIDGQTGMANKILARITDPAERATALAYQALARADVISAVDPALTALSFGDVGPIIGVLELTPPAKSNVPCDSEPVITRKCLAERVRRTVTETGDPSVVALGQTLAAAMESRMKEVINRLETSTNGTKAIIALSVQRAYVVMNKPDRAESLSRYVGRIDPAYALNKALAENDLPAALKATEIAVRSGALHAFLDLYQDAPAYPDSVF